MSVYEVTVWEQVRQDKPEEGKEGCWSPQQLPPPSPGFPGAGMAATGTFQSTLFNSVSVCEALHSRLSPLREHSPFLAHHKTKILKGVCTCVGKAC